MKTLDIPSYFLFGAAVGTFLTFALSSQPFLTDIYLVGFCAIAGAITTIFIDYLIAPKQIFGSWQKVLKRLSETKLKELAKPLGLCIYCMNVYVFTACFLVLYMKTDISWWYFIPSAGFSHVALAYIDRKINS